MAWHNLRITCINIAEGDGKTRMIGRLDPQRYHDISRTYEGRAPGRRPANLSDTQVVDSSQVPLRHTLQLPAAAPSRA